MFPEQGHGNQMGCWGRGRAAGMGQMCLTVLCAQGDLTEHAERHRLGRSGPACRRCVCHSTSRLVLTSPWTQHSETLAGSANMAAVRWPCVLSSPYPLYPHRHRSGMLGATSGSQTRHGRESSGRGAQLWGNQAPDRGWLWASRRASWGNWHLKSLDTRKHWGQDPSEG